MSYCDMCDRSPRDTEPYVVDGYTFNWCDECTDEGGIL